MGQHNPSLWSGLRVNLDELKAFDSWDEWEDMSKKGVKLGVNELREEGIVSKGVFLPVSKSCWMMTFS